MHKPSGSTITAPARGPRKRKPMYRMDAVITHAATLTRRPDSVIPERAAIDQRPVILGTDQWTGVARQRHDPARLEHRVDRAPLKTELLKICPREERTDDVDELGRIRTRAHAAARLRRAAGAPAKHSIQTRLARRRPVTHSGRSRSSRTRLHFEQAPKRWNGRSPRWRCWVTTSSVTLLPLPRTRGVRL
jgi:hypothetical protein